MGYLQMSHLVENVRGRKSSDEGRPGMIDAVSGVNAGAETVCGDEFGVSLMAPKRTVDLCATGNKGWVQHLP